MSEQNLTRLTATEIARRVRSRETTATAVVEAHLDEIRRVNPRLNAVCTLAADHALAAAAKLDGDIEAGKDPGLLAGVPVGVKDVHPTAGIRTTYGSDLYRDYVPTEDALFVQRVKAAGGIVIGKTNTPEFAAGANTYNAVFGPTRNPWNPALSASGSTGGGAAGLASYMFPLATGSDLGGSVRTPAAFCGVVGLRPTPGLIPRWPTPAPWAVLDVAGPMARTVEDTALMLQAVAGPSDYAGISLPVDGRDFVAAARGGMKPGLRVAYCPDVAGIGVDHEIERICRRAAFDLAQDGAAVEQIEFDLAFARPAFIRLRGQYMVDRHLDKLDKLDRLNPNLAGNIRAGLAQSPRDVALGEQGRTQLFERFRKLFETYDLLVTPCTAVPPFPVERNYPETINGKPMATYIDWVAPTFVITLAGVPAISVPAGLTADGLPVGLQIVGRRSAEEVVLGAAAAVERSKALTLPESVPA
jgi:amidase